MVFVSVVTTNNWANPHASTGLWTETRSRKIARGADGILWVAVGDYLVSPGTLQIFKSTDNGATWTLDGTIAPGLASYIVKTPCMMVSNDGTVQVAFAYENAGIVKIFHSQRSGGVWSSPTLILTQVMGATGGHYISACVDPSGNVHIIFQWCPVASFIGCTTEYLTNETGPWVRTVLQAWDGFSATPFAVGAMIASDDHGNIHMFYFHGLVTQNSYYKYLKKTAGAGWDNIMTNGEIIETIFNVLTSETAYQNSIFVDKDGTVHFAWVQWLAGYSQTAIAYAYRTASGISAIETVDPAVFSSRPFYHPSVCVTTQGDVFIGYQSTDGSFQGHSKVVKRISAGSFSLQHDYTNANDSDGTFLLSQSLPSVGFPSGFPKIGWCGLFVQFNTPSTTETVWFVKSDDLLFDDGSGLADEGPPSYPTPTNFPSVPLTGEGFPTLIYPFTPEYVMPYTERFRTERSLSDGGYEVTWPKVSKSRRQWIIRHAALSSTQIAQLKQFLEDTSGPKLSFWLTIPEPVENVKAHFIGNTFDFIKVNPNVYEVQFLCEEIF